MNGLAWRMKLRISRDLHSEISLTLHSHYLYHTWISHYPSLLNECVRIELVIGKLEKCKPMLVVSIGKKEK